MLYNTENARVDNLCNVIQGAMNQMGPPMQQGHFMGMNPMQQGPPSGGGGGTQMYSSGATFNRPPMPGLGPYQVTHFLYTYFHLFINYYYFFLI